MSAARVSVWPARGPASLVRWIADAGTPGTGQRSVDGGLYVFINRRGNQTHVLRLDRSGFCLWAKRLDAGRFTSDWRTVRSRAVDWTALKLLWEGIELGRQRKRFKLASVQE